MTGWVRIPAVLALLCLVGLAISTYLTVAHWGGQPLACGGLDDCNYVNSSEYAKVAGIPVSVLGGLMYIAMLGAAVGWLLRREDERLRLVFWGLALTGVGYAMYLTYIELAVLHAICPWCVTSAVILSLCLALSTLAVLSPSQGAADPSFAGPAGRKPTAIRKGNTRTGTVR